MKRRICLFLMLLLALLPAAALAEMPTLPSGVAAYTADFYVADYADILSDEIEGLIVFNNDALDKACGAQIVVVTVDEALPGAIENYAFTLFNDWKIGNKTKNNGLLILMDMHGGQYWLMPGKGLQDYLTAGDLDEMATEYLLPSAQIGNYEEGIRQLFAACFEKVSIAYDAGLTLDDTLYYNWLQTGSATAEGAKFLAAPVREGAFTQPVSIPEEEVQPVVTAEPAPERRDEGGFNFMTLILILIVLLVVFGAIGVLRSRPGRRAPVRRTPMPPPMSPMNGGYRNVPPMSRPRAPRPPVSMPVRPAARPPMSAPARPAHQRPTVTRPASGFGGNRVGGGGMTRGGGTGGSFARPSMPRTSPRPASRPISRPSGGGGMTRGGGTGGSFRGGR